MNTFWGNEQRISSALAEVTTYLKGVVDDANPYIREHLVGMLESRGKMLRPALAVIASSLGDAQCHDTVIRYAAVLELIHLASLIHDDIIDASDTRRGRPTLYKELGARRSVIAGDYLLSRTLFLLSDQKDTSLSELVSSTMNRLCDSEIDQDSEQWNFQIPVARYIRRIAGKTAALFALSGYVGAYAAKAREEHCRSMHEVGYNLGMSFQIRDDILDMTGELSRLGKPSFKDLSTGVASLPILLALEGEPSGRLRRILGTNHRLTRTEIRQARILIQSTDCIERSGKIADSYELRALRIAVGLGDPELYGTLQRLVNRLSNRSV